MAKVRIPEGYQRAKYRTQIKYPHWYKVLICGSRHWEDAEAVIRVLKALRAEHGMKLVIISGGAPGADTIANQEALRLGIHAARVPAIWHYYGNSAGPIRNQVMLSLRPREVIAFHEDLLNSKGTKRMVVQSFRCGLRVRLWGA